MLFFPICVIQQQVWLDNVSDTGLQLGIFLNIYCMCKAYFAEKKELFVLQNSHEKLKATQLLKHKEMC